ncbi:MAG: VCBS repeat-containing protein, partial [Bacteroidota bacterium]
MKFTLTLCLALVITASVTAQIFVEKAPDFPFKAASRGDLDFADVDGDGDQDVLISGSCRCGTSSSLYINENGTHFILAENTPFPPMYDSAVNFADLDNDGDQDLILMGKTGSAGLVSLLYQNDGSGEFTLVPEHPIEAVSEANIIFVDVDNNSYLDIIVQKGDGGLEKEVRLYLNEGGINNLQLVPDTPFEAIRLGSMALSDVDGDNDPDILITGMDSEAEPTVNLYLNDGTGQFTLDPNTPFQALTQGSIDFADVDGDNDQDVLVSGFMGSLLGSSTLLYLNNGEGQFSLAPNASFIGAIWVKAQFADLDNDGDQDILVAGISPSTRVYLNNGLGEFSLLEHEDIELVGFVSFAIEDVDGDDDLDVLLTGVNGLHGSIAHLYTNDGSARFNIVEHGFINAAVGRNGSVAIADTDNDNDLDILITGREGQS